MASCTHDSRTFDSVYRQVAEILKGRFLLTLIAWLIVSSCMGDGFRARYSNVSINPRHVVFDRNYLRTVTSSGQGTWNQIEMDDMLGDSPRSSTDSDRHR